MLKPYMREPRGTVHAHSARRSTWRVAHALTRESRSRAEVRDGRSGIWTEMEVRYDWIRVNELAVLVRMSCSTYGKDMQYVKFQ